MLTIAAVVLLLSAAGCVVIAKVAHVAMKRLGLELWEVLMWLGIAEAPADELAARRARPLGEPRRSLAPSA